jgi:hypothetical protein
MDQHIIEWDDNSARDVEYGFQDARRMTTYEHQGSSSLTLVQSMEHKVYTSLIYYFFDHALDYLQVLVHFLTMFTWLCLFVHQWERMMGENVGRAAKEAQEMMTCVQAKFNELEILVVCLMVLAKVAYLHIEDCIYLQEDLFLSKTK